MWVLFWWLALQSLLSGQMDLVNCLQKNYGVYS